MCSIKCCLIFTLSFSYFDCSFSFRLIYCQRCFSLSTIYTPVRFVWTQKCFSTLSFFRKSFLLFRFLIHLHTFSGSPIFIHTNCITKITKETKRYWWNCCSMFTYRQKHTYKYKLYVCLFHAARFVFRFDAFIFDCIIPILIIIYRHYCYLCLYISLCYRVYWEKQKQHTAKTHTIPKRARVSDSSSSSFSIIFLSFTYPHIHPFSHIHWLTLHNYRKCPLYF